MLKVNNNYAFSESIAPAFSIINLRVSLRIPVSLLSSSGFFAVSCFSRTIPADANFSLVAVFNPLREVSSIN